MKTLCLVISSYLSHHYTRDKLCPSFLSCTLLPLIMFLAARQWPDPSIGVFYSALFWKERNLQFCINDKKKHRKLNQLFFLQCPLNGGLTALYKGMALNETQYWWSLLWLLYPYSATPRTPRTHRMGSRWTEWGDSAGLSPVWGRRLVWELPCWRRLGTSHCGESQPCTRPTSRVVSHISF